LFISIDLGYGYTKAISEKNRAIFPSVLAPAQESGLNYGKSYGHVLEYRKPGEMNKQAVFVGELARKEGRAARVSLSRDKFKQDETILYALTAAYLTGAEKQVNLAVGLPLDYYRLRKQETENFLRSVSAHVSVDGGPEKYISFTSVKVLPQAVGALYAQKNLPDKGLLGVIDIGFCTTDCILVECLPEDVVLLKSYTLSLDTAVSTAVKLFRNKITEATGTPLSPVNAFELWVNGEREITVQGRPVNTGAMIDYARREVGKALVQAVLAAWSEKADLLRGVLLCGGGALEFQDEIKTLLPQSEVVSEPQWANAMGFYRLAGGCIHPESQERQGFEGKNEGQVYTPGVNTV
jgi:plasmid segregation protein ParM